MNLISRQQNWPKCFRNSREPPVQCCDARICDRDNSAHPPPPAIHEVDPSRNLRGSSSIQRCEAVGSISFPFIVRRTGWPNHS